MPYLFSFDGKNANSTTQNLNTIVPVPYQLVNGSGTTVVSGTLNLPPPASVAEDNPSSAWNNLFATIIPPADGIYRLELRFPGGGTGNDFYIDNISLRSLTEYGDAPVAYGEAVHGQPANNLSSACEPLVVLGNRLDIENSNLSSPEADGDNTSNADDEDGVALPDLAPNATSYTAVVTASNRTATPLQFMPG
ncbi:hypothetical protein [Niabella hibiscisoli]|uniref:hypothetical protein n=1 Tax=Niabella hibiscisoli TaxID=1825928 RepID=UPI001F0D0F9E|nr:hypothetical protein [Niabella hibiscisoli]MCH5721090.1 hypothetical protein [Niabella hibiscisoli]